MFTMVLEDVVWIAGTIINLSDKDKQYYNLLLQSYDSSKKMLEMRPDSALYKSMVANDKERLDQFEAKHNIKS